jgi:thioesterase domain-containing protein/acyl carrier protein
MLDALPLTPNGKVDRRALPAPIGVQAYAKRDLAEPRTEYEFALKRIWEELLGVRPIGVRDNFFELGGHSLLAVRMMNEIEKTYGRRIPLVSLFQGATIEQLATILREDTRQHTWPALIEIQKGNDQPPLFCVSMPNVNALGYVALARHLGPDQTVYGLQAQYPEDLQGEHSQAAVDDLATEYLEAIRALRPYGPYQFVGMCRGAHIAYEMARRLEREGQQVAFMGILDTWVLENTYNRFLYIEYYAKRLRSFLQLNRRDKLEFVKRKTSGGDGTQNGAPTTSADQPAKTLRNPMHAYFPGPDFKPKTYGGRVAVFRTHKQPLNRIRDKELGWGKLVAEGVDLHYVPGSHGSSVLSEPNVQVLARAVKQYLIK